MHGDPTIPAPDIQRANALLCAAAPDLLSACEEWVEIDGPYVSLAEQRRRWSGVVDRMRTTIAKARGVT